MRTLTDDIAEFIEHPKNKLTWASPAFVDDGRGEVPIPNRPLGPDFNRANYYVAYGAEAPRIVLVKKRAVAS